MILTVIIVLLFLYVFMTDTCRAGLVSKPDAKNKIQMAKDVLQHEKLFRNNTQLNDVRQYFPWIDAVIHEDLRKLMSNGNFNLNHIIKVLS